MDLNDLENVIERHGEDIINHNNRICNIEINNGMVNVQIQNLIKSVDQLIASIKLVFFGALGVGFGFMVWYLQKL